MASPILRAFLLCCPLGLLDEQVASTLETFIALQMAVRVDLSMAACDAFTGNAFFVPYALWG
jgi:hypothetical protein